MGENDEGPVAGDDADKIGGSTASEVARPRLEILGNATAPFVYFDIAPAHSIEAGTVIIELVAVTYIPIDGSKSRPEIVSTGHLRTTVAGMRSLRKAIDEIELLIAPAANPDGPKN